MDTNREILYSMHSFSLSEGQKERIMHNKDIDWGNIVSQARRMGLSNTLYWKTGRIKGLVPEKNLTSLKHTYLITLSKNLKIEQEISDLCKEMKKKNIPYVIIQGWPLILSVYEDMGLRDTLDIDVYVPVEGLKKTVQLLLDAGYSSRSLPFKKFSRCRHVNFTKTNSAVIELTTDPFKLTAPIKNKSRFFEESWMCRVGDSKARIPSYEYMLLGLIVHFQREKISYPGAVYDIAYLIQTKKNNLNWDKFIDITNEENLRIPVYFCLKIVREIFAPPIPGYVFKGLDSSVTQKRLYLELRGGYGDWLKRREPDKKACSSVFLYDWLTRSTLKEKAIFIFLEIVNYTRANRKNAPLYKLFTQKLPKYITALLRFRYFGP